METWTNFQFHKAFTEKGRANNQSKAQNAVWERAGQSGRAQVWLILRKVRTKSHATHFGKRIGAALQQMSRPEREREQPEWCSCSDTENCALQYSSPWIWISWFHRPLCTLCLCRTIFCYIIPLECCKSFFSPKLQMPATISLPSSIGDRWVFSLFSQHLNL